MNIKPVKQRGPNDCVRTSISMVSGYDYEVLPELTIIRDPLDYTVVLNTEGVIEVAGDRYHEPEDGGPLGVSFYSFARIYRKFYNLRFQLHRRRPLVPSVRVSPFYGHAIVDLGNGYIDPLIGKVRQETKLAFDPNCIWFTVEPIA